jgi:stress-induced morphogen
MSLEDRSDRPDPRVQRVLDALRQYEQAHPHAEIVVRRQNPVSIRIRIIDPDFKRQDKIEREKEVWRILDTLSDELPADISMLLLLTPEEAPNSFANMEFEHPIPSLL